MSSWAKPGVRCVCINDGVDEQYVWELGAEIFKGSVYTIYSVWTNSDGGTALDFVEVSRQAEAIEFWGEMVGYDAARFRPLISQSDDISLFHALCPGLPVVPPAVVPKRQSVTSHSD